MERNVDGAFYITGGTIPPDAPSYVVRGADADLLDGLRSGEFCYILTTRQMGKSSLMVRAAAALRAQQTTVAFLDLTAVGLNVSAEQWYNGLLAMLVPQIARGVSADVTTSTAEAKSARRETARALSDFLTENAHLGLLQQFMGALEQVFLPRVGRDAEWVIFVDEVDAVRTLPFSTDEFFTAIRACYNRRVENPDLKRLTFCLTGVATPADLVQNVQLSPFNIGRRIVLNDFTEKEARVLASTAWLAGEMELRDFAAPRESAVWGKSYVAGSLSGARKRAQQRVKAQKVVDSSPKLPVASDLAYSGDYTEEEQSHVAERLSGFFARVKYRNVTSAEASIRKERDEHSVFLSRDGKFLAAFRGKGDRINYNFSEQDIELLRGSIRTHNHLRDVSFSTDDMRTACRLEMKESRAVGPNMLFVLRPGTAIWNSVFYEEVFSPAYDRAERFVLENQLEEEDDDGDFIHKTWIEVSRQLGMVYLRYGKDGTRI